MLYQCDKCKGVSWHVIRRTKAKIKYFCVSTRGKKIDITDSGRLKAVCADCGNESPYFKIFDSDYAVEIQEETKT